MRLRSLSVNNFRCFAITEKPTTVDLDASTVLFCGKNGVGKTTLFDAIEFALTGSVKRLDSLGPLGNFLVNVRHRDKAATVRLTIDRSGKPELLESTIRPNSVRGNGILHASQTTAFEHTCYLAQWSIQHLVQAGAATLGDVVWKLAVDPTIDLLISGLAEAHIDRRTRYYQQVVSAVQDAELQLTTLTTEINTKTKDLQSVLPDEAAQQSWHEKYLQIAKRFGRSVDQKPLTANDLISHISSLTRAIQQELTSELRKQEDIQRQVDALNALLQQQAQADALSEQVRKIDLDRTIGLERLNTLRAEVAAANEKLGAAASRAGNLGKLIAALNQTAEIAAADICPICDRPFSNLREHIDAKLNRLSEENSRYAAEISAWRSSISGSNNQIGTTAAHVRSLELQQSELTAQLVGFEQRKTALLESYKTDVPGTATIEQAISSVKLAGDRLANRISDLRLIASEVESLYATVSSATMGLQTVRTQLESLKARAAEQQQQIGRAREHQQSVEAFINVVSELRARLESKFSSTLDEFVRMRAAGSFKDLFQRLTRNPYFDVELSNLGIKYHKPELGWFATSEGSRFEGPGVFSFGDLNACGLAMFLALAAAQPSHLGILLLDDPVQNMDEVHIEEFAHVLKSVKDNLGWQLVVGVHEDAVFEYLRRQLHPSQPGQSILAYVLEQTQEGPAIRSAGRHEFVRSDFVEFGSTAA